MADLLIGEVLTGVKVPTIQYYEGAGMPPAARPVETTGGFTMTRRSSESRSSDTRNLGFSMRDIKALIAFQDNPAQSCCQADAIARARLAEIELHIRHLQSLQAELQAMIGRRCRQRVSQCRVIEGLVGATG